MAITVFDLVKDLEATVIVNGQPLKEYDDDEAPEEPPGIIPEDPTKRTVREWQNMRTIRKYVEVVEGADFLINVKLNPGFRTAYHTLICNLKINGVSVGCRVLLPNGFGNRPPHRTILFGGVCVSAPGGPPNRFLFRKFKFLKIEQSRSSFLHDRHKSYAKKFLQHLMII